MSVVVSVVHVFSAHVKRAVRKFGRRGDKAFSALWPLMLDLPSFERSSNAGMSVKTQCGRGGNGPFQHNEELR